MSLNLDPRHRAMLAEMGVRVWWPQPGAEPVGQADLNAAQANTQDTTDNIASSADQQRARGQNHQNSLTDHHDPASGLTGTATQPGTSPGGAASVPPAATRPAPASQTARRSPGPAALLPLPEGIATMDWPSLSDAVAHCQACAMCLGRQAAVFTPLPADLHCDWLVLAEPPDDAQERAGQPFVGEAGQLLDNMLKAVGVRRYLPAATAADAPAATRGPDVASVAVPAASEPMAYLSHVLKCRPARPTAPDAAALAACAHYLRREIALLQPKVILAMGRYAMQVLLGQDHPGGLTLPLGKLRGQVWHYQGVPVVVTYPPAYLLRNGQDKARAWADLCLALDVVQGLAPDH